MGQKTEMTSVARYAPYIEAKHSSFLDDAAIRRVAIEDDSPYDTFTDIEIEAAFFGTGYLISSFPSLYDMFGKFMAGLDVDALFDQIFEDTVNGTAIDNLVSAEADRLSDDIEQDAAPRFETGMRDMNAVMSSSFVIGRALMETIRTKAVSRFSAEVRSRMIPVATERWGKHLEWNKAVTDVYAQVLKFYISAKMDINTHNFEMKMKDKVWPFTVLQYEGACLGVLQGARSVEERKPLLPQIIGTAMSVAGMAAML
jgi:hypothetical protein